MAEKKVETPAKSPEKATLEEDFCKVHGRNPRDFILRLFSTEILKLKASIVASQTCSEVCALLISCLRDSADMRCQDDKFEEKLGKSEPI